MLEAEEASGPSVPAASGRGSAAPGARMACGPGCHACRPGAIKGSRPACGEACGGRAGRFSGPDGQGRWGGRFTRALRDFLKEYNAHYVTDAALVSQVVPTPPVAPAVAGVSQALRQPGLDPRRHACRVCRGSVGRRAAMEARAGDAAAACDWAPAAQASAVCREAAAMRAECSEPRPRSPPVPQTRLLPRAGKRPEILVSAPSRTLPNTTRAQQITCVRVVIGTWLCTLPRVRTSADAKASGASSARRAAPRYPVPARQHRP